MPVLLGVFFNQQGYFPGEAVNATVRIHNHQTGPSATEQAYLLNELFVDCSGSERVDPVWIGKLYQPDVAAVKDNRRLLRQILRCQPPQLISQPCLLTPGASLSWSIRVRLPPRLPPSFRGSALKYSYHVQAVAKLQLAEGIVVDDSLAAGLQPSPSAHSITSTSSKSTLSGMPGATPAQAQLPPPSISTQLTVQAETGFIVWPAQKGSGDDLRAMSRTGSIAMRNHEAEGDAPLLEYPLNAECKVKWELQDCFGTKGPTLLSPEVSGQLSTLQSSLWTEDESMRVPSFLGDMPSDEAESDGDDRSAHPGGSSVSPVTHTPRLSTNKIATTAKSYVLRMGSSALVKFSLQPPMEGSIQPGRTFGGVLDFRVGREEGGQTTGTEHLRCLQVSVALESEESVSPDCLSTRTSMTPGSTPGTVRRLWAEHCDATPDTLLTHFTFSLPPSAPPSFRTPMVALRWLLRFELVTGVIATSATGERNMRATPEPLLWTLPLLVLPPVA